MLRSGPQGAGMKWAGQFFFFIYLFDLMLYFHGKQLRSCWDGQLPNHTVPGQAPVAVCQN